MLDLGKLIKKVSADFVWSQNCKQSVILPGITTHLVFPKCDLFISIDIEEYGGIRIEISNPNEILNKKDYLMEDVLGCLISNYRHERKLPDNLPLIDVLQIESLDERREANLRNYFLVIQTYLIPVIKGDFSWVKKQELFEKNRRLIGEKLKTVFIFDHPIYIKLIKDDPTWKDDLISSSFK